MRIGDEDAGEWKIKLYEYNIEGNQKSIKFEGGGADGDTMNSFRTSMEM